MIQPESHRKQQKFSQLPSLFVVRDDADAWLAYATQYPNCLFAIATKHEMIGAMGLHFHSDVHRKSAMLGYWLGEPFWGQGIVSPAVPVLVDYAFANFDLVRLYAYVFEWNPTLMRVLEKVGFVLEGRLRKHVSKDGELIDELLYALVRE